MAAAERGGGGGGGREDARALGYETAAAARAAREPLRLAATRLRCAAEPCSCLARRATPS